MQEAKDYLCWCGKLTDKFADHGLVTVVIGQMKGDELHIILWLMSCRVLKRGMEDVMMKAMIQQTKNYGITKIEGYYYPTAKNMLVKDFYKDRGFTQLSEDNSGNTKWELDIDRCMEAEIHMSVRECM